ERVSRRALGWRAAVRAARGDSLPHPRCHPHPLCRPGVWRAGGGHQEGEPHFGGSADWLL
ncbi:unnamed protein product, partial [Closterium sp. Naga37s-1]